MTTRPFPQSAPASGDPEAGPGVFRPSATFPLPALRPVPDFVALPSARRYVTVAAKLRLALGASAVWLSIAAVVGALALPAMDDVVPWPIGILVYLVVVALPGALVTFAVAGLVLDQPPTPAVARPAVPVTVAVTARNQPRTVVETLASLAAQDYDGPVTVILVDNGSTDATVDEARRAAARMGTDLKVLVERRIGDVHARNAAVACTDTPLLVVVRAGTVLHPSAVRLLVARLLRSPADTASVSAHVLVRNTRAGDAAAEVARDYACRVHASQRLHGLFHGPLATEGACSLYRVDALRAVDGWPRGGDDGVLLAWQFLERGWRVFHEPLALAFTSQPVTIGSWASRRVGAASAIADGARAAGLASLPFRSSRLVTAIDAVAPAVDGVFTGGMVLALALATMGAPALVWAYVGLVLPVSLGAVVAMRRAESQALDDAGLRLPGGPRAWVATVLGVHAVQAPLAAGHALARVFGRVEP